MVDGERLLRTWCRPLGLLLSGAAVLLANVAAADEPAAESPPVFSGPLVGETLPPLKVHQVLGPRRDVPPTADGDLVAAAGGKPVLFIFVHERTRPAFGLANLLTRFAATRDEAGLHRWLIFLSDDLTEAEAWVRRIPKYFEKGTPVGISPDGVEGPGAYGLNRNVALTVLVGREGQVTANFALVQPSIQADGPKILKAIVDVTGGGDVPDITPFLPQGMRERTPPATEGDAQLRTLLRGVIQQEATEQDVAAAAKAVDDYVAKNEAARQELGQIAQRVVSSPRFDEYGTAASRKQLTRWAKTYGAAQEPVAPPGETPAPKTEPPAEGD